MDKKKHIIVYSHKNFEKVCSTLGLDDSNVESSSYAFIDIICTEDCNKIYNMNISHVFSDNHPNVINLEFDDVEKDEHIKGYHIKAISPEQADKLIDFIDNNLDKDFKICCHAGKSRSQGVFYFMMLMYNEYFEKCNENEENPCLTPNYDVVGKLRRSFLKKNNYKIEE